MHRTDKTRRAVARWLVMSGGAALFLHGLLRKRPYRALEMMAGAALIRSARRGAPRPREEAEAPRPDLEKKFGDRTRDIVEETSWESFPASDPPARY